jgi:VanZ family protein
VKAWIKKHSIFLSLIPVLLIMVMIFCFSAQTGEESGQMSGQITRWVIGLFAQDFENWPAAEQEVMLVRVGFVIRKGAHFSEYALLGFFLMLHILQIAKRTTVKLPWLWAWGIATFYAATDEFHQAFVGGRGPALRDVLIDSCGVAAGVALLCLIFRRQIHTCNSQKKPL